MSYSEPTRRRWEPAGDYWDRMKDWRKEGQYDARDREDAELVPEVVEVPETMEERRADWNAYVRQVNDLCEQVEVIRGE